MLGLGWGEILLVAGVALIVVGPERLPRLLRDLGRMYGQVRRAADDLRRSFVLEAERQDAEERYQRLQERRQAQAAARAEALRVGAAPEEVAPGDEAPSEAEAAPVPFGGPTTVATGTLSDDGFIDGAPAAPPPDDGAHADGPDPNADDPEAPHPVQPARSERP